MTIPTPGRVMLFHPAADQQTNCFVLPRAGEPLAGLVAAVSPCGKFVSLTVSDADGWPHPKQNVPVVQDGEPVPEGGYYAFWMPWQVEQARRNEAMAARAYSPIGGGPFFGGATMAAGGAGQGGSSGSGISHGFAGNGMSSARGKLEFVPDDSARETRRHMLGLAVEFCRDTCVDAVTVAQQYEKYVNGEK